MRHQKHRQVKASAKVTQPVSGKAKAASFAFRFRAQVLSPHLWGCPPLRCDPQGLWFRCTECYAVIFEFPTEERASKRLISSSRQRTRLVVSIPQAQFSPLEGKGCICESTSSAWQGIHIYIHTLAVTCGLCQSAYLPMPQFLHLHHGH